MNYSCQTYGLDVINGNTFHAMYFKCRCTQQSNNIDIIFNLAKIKLSIHEQQVLSKGLKFCPTPMSNKTAVYVMAIRELKRKLLLQAYHVGTDPDANSTPITPMIDPNLAFQQKHKPKSSWIPPKQVCNPIIHNFA
jgi:hypothetical protein